MKKYMIFCADTILMSYARIFFAENRLLGTIVCCATLNVPILGLFGLLGGALSSLFAALIGMDRDSVRKGVYGLNGILVGLGIGYYFMPSAQVLLILVLAALLLTCVTVLLNTLLFQQTGLPAMSMPFNLLTWLIVGSTAAVSGLQPHGEHLHLLALPEECLPQWLAAFLSALGAVLYLPNQVTGLLIAVGLTIWSRIALLLMLAGFATSCLLQVFLGIDVGVIGAGSLTFNQMFAALAIGGIFTVPGPGSLLLAIATATVSLFILTGIGGIFPASMSPLALPFNLAVMLCLFTLRSRLHPSFDLRLAPNPPGSPEENLSHYRENLRSWKRWGVALSLPFRDHWKVAQGVDGAITHQGDWRFAYDFQALAADGTLYCNAGLACEDYYSWGAAVLAPASGTVYSVCDGIADNEIGMINAEHNWGNCVIIYHAENYYSCLAHLQMGSISVKPGDLLAKGDQVARCGNSGRSPYPHLHFQMQMSPLAGAPGIEFTFQNFMVMRNERECFVSRGEIREDENICNAVACQECAHYFPYSLGSGWTFMFENGERSEREMWEAGVDFYGNSYITSYPQQTRLYFLLQEGVLTIKKVEGSRTSGLFLFGSILAEVPFVEAASDSSWTSLEAADYVLWPYITKLFDVFSLVGVSLRQKIVAQLVKIRGEIHVTTVSQILIDTPFGAIPIRRLPEGELLFSREGGLILCRAGSQVLRQG
jgi:urea transporter/murein DD-endopeptidase MepM/ murein hydrolase activator NlpD